MGELLFLNYLEEQRKEIPDFPREAVFLHGIESLLGDFEQWLETNGHLKKNQE